jgi:hypothetical protein
MGRRVSIGTARVAGSVEWVECAESPCGTVVRSGGATLRDGQQVLVAVAPSGVRRVIPLDGLVVLSGDEAAAVAAGLDHVLAHGVEGQGGDVTWTRLEELQRQLRRAEALALEGS